MSRRESAEVIAAEVPIVYRIIRSLSIEEERALRRHLSDDMRVALWRHHLKTYLDEHDDLTAEQRTIIEEARELLAEGRTDDRSHRARAEAAFPLLVLHQLFGVMTARR